MLHSHPEIDVISLCHPPRPRFTYAQIALQQKKHVMLEKPPGATVSECLALQQLAQVNQRTLYATWHSRQADMVDSARVWLSNKEIWQVTITWREDVCRWHKGQDWIWNPGGFGVLDPGINALSIVTEILDGTLHPVSAEFLQPENKSTPIAADIEFAYSGGGRIEANFDWRERGEQQWNIQIQTSDGELTLTDGGAIMLVNGTQVKNTEQFERMANDSASNTLSNEYRRLYGRMADLIRTQQSDVDLTPLQLIADSYTLAKVTTSKPFFEV